MMPTKSFFEVGQTGQTIGLTGLKPTISRFWDQLPTKAGRSFFLGTVTEARSRER